MNGLFGPFHIIAACIIIAVFVAGLRMLRAVIRLIVKP